MNNINCIDTARFFGIKKCARWMKHSNYEWFFIFIYAFFVNPRYSSMPRQFWKQSKLNFGCNAHHETNGPN